MGHSAEMTTILYFQSNPEKKPAGIESVKSIATISSSNRGKMPAFCEGRISATFYLTRPNANKLEAIAEKIIWMIQFYDSPL
jgi:hypothetical protein